MLKVSNREYDAPAVRNFSRAFANRPDAGRERSRNFRAAVDALKQASTGEQPRR